MFGKAEDKANEAAGAVEEAFGKAVDSPEHQVRGAARKYASQASYAARDAADSVRTRWKPTRWPAWPLRRRSASFSASCWDANNGEFAARQQARYGPFFALPPPACKLSSITAIA